MWKKLSSSSWLTRPTPAPQSGLDGSNREGGGVDPASGEGGGMQQSQLYLSKSSAAGAPPSVARSPSGPCALPSAERGDQHHHPISGASAPITVSLRLPSAASLSCALKTFFSSSRLSAMS